MLTAFAAAGCGSGKEVKNEQDNPVSPAAVEKESRVLKEAFEEDFTVGVAVNMGTLNDSDRMKSVCSHFSSITMENEMKPDSLLDGKATEKSSDGMPEINTKRLDLILSRAKENSIPLRGHTLCGITRLRTGSFQKIMSLPRGWQERVKCGKEWKHTLRRY